MTLRALYNKLTGKLGSGKERLITPSMFLEYANEVREEMAARGWYNIETFRGQTEAGKMDYGFPRLLEVRSLRLGVEWDDETDECTDPGYELWDSMHARRLSFEELDRRVKKGTLEVT